MSVKELRKKIKRAIKGNLQVAIEDGLHIEPGATVMGGVNFGSEPYLITLHRNCRISSNVTLITHDGGMWAINQRFSEYRDIVKFGSIDVGEGAFIGAKSTIMPGVRIGAFSVVGAGSVVTKSIPPETVWAGVPAKQICTLKEYAEKCKAQMIEGFDTQAYQKDKKAYLIELMIKGKI